MKVIDEKHNLKDKEYLFANYYLGEANLNATEAAKLAGYSKNTARQQGSRMLTNVNIKKYIQSKTTDILAEMGVSQEKILRELVSLAFTDVSDFLNDDYSLKPLNEIPKEKTRAVNLRVSESNRLEGRTKSISTNMSVRIKALKILWNLVK